MDTRRRLVPDIVTLQAFDVPPGTVISRVRRKN